MSKTLRSLAKDYAEGILDKEAYRKARDDYLHGVLEGTITVEPIEYRPPVEMLDLDATQERTNIRPHDPRETIDGSTALSRENSDAKSATESGLGHENTQGRSTAAENTSSPYLIVSAVILILAGIGVSFALLKQSGSANNQSVATVAEQTVVPVAEPASEIILDTPSEAEVLMENFLQQKDWSETSLQDFKAQWQSLDATDQQQGLASPLHSQLVNAIHKKLLEERALLGLGESEEVVNRQQQLVNFANAIDIHDPRLVVVGKTAEEAVVDDVLTAPAESDEAAPAKE